MNKKTLLITLVILFIIGGQGKGSGPEFTFVPPQQMIYWTPPPEFAAPGMEWKPPPGYEKYAQPWKAPDWWEQPQEWTPPSEFQNVTTKKIEPAPAEPKPLENLPEWRE